jgi:hypothetical protein
LSRAPTNGVTVVEHAFPLPISSVSLDGPKSYPAGSVVDAWLAPSTRTVSVEPVRTKPTTCHRPSLTLLDVERFTVGAGRGAFDEKMNNRPSLPMATFHCGKLPQFPPAQVRGGGRRRLGGVHVELEHEVARTECPERGIGGAEAV